MRRFFIEKADLVDSRAVIGGPDAHHIKTVLRLKVSDAIEIIDGTGMEYTARITGFPSGTVALRVLDKRICKTETPVKITLAIGMLKDKKMDELVRRLTELGVSCWAPFFAARSVPRPDPQRLTARTARWKKIAVEALKQSRRSRMPEIMEPVAFKDMLSLARGSDLKIIFWENQAAETVSTIPTLAEQPCKKIFVILGPEGGFTREEINTARSCGFITASLGPRILRAETAALAAAVMMQFIFGDMGKFA
ncbi:MAG: 16S rRNA (uracil(1498)-N(3))-methyltransferase [Desulfobacteraceae bacterium 4572_123]|nr:MAG: 16S rRNA (uracil(1498)-N(3))-methyltransferase [Desulfobacteraceae bacterium 4572_123]